MPMKDRSLGSTHTTEQSQEHNEQGENSAEGEDLVDFSNKKNGD